MIRGVQPDRVDPKPGPDQPKNRVGNRFPIKPIREPIPIFGNRLKPVREPGASKDPPELDRFWTQNSLCIVLLSFSVFEELL